MYIYIYNVSQAQMRPIDEYMRYVGQVSKHDLSKDRSVTGTGIRAICQLFIWTFKQTVNSEIRISMNTCPPSQSNGWQVSFPGGGGGGIDYTAMTWVAGAFPLTLIGFAAD